MQQKVKKENKKNCYTNIVTCIIISGFMVGMIIRKFDLLDNFCQSYSIIVVRIIGTIWMLHNTY